ncbi:nitrite reductase large subunit NirB [Glycomyces algeriensis]|uniref:assimilatory sulfite reductase (ferredoxin) n=1 Tax=Glycomyces algeriensis TaxID=256037 RepID=A0A9W6LFP3_9ACTN|nr:nitrite reductase large subunit NirB [Glycomyces algeriensis]MDA1367919.1 nitrite reductase large subunit NirB [Glycomyces algeriensis]MDR7349458.1 nitrite reductase (NADH) large subunit [Glycomyces algeriensis]GLI42162.1 nitrite reductase large subunit [Glycomyces algeriensis]
MSKLVVIGDGMVGRRFLEAVTQRDPSWEVTVLCEEPRPAYDRVRLSAFFDGVSAEELSLASELDGVDVRLGEAAVSIDREAKVVRSASGEYAYDKLVFATGSYAFVPPMEGADLEGVFVYRTIEDLEAIKAHSQGRRHGVVIGGGLLGLEAANALKLLGLETQIVEFAPWLMARQLDEAGGGILKQHIVKLGIGVDCGTGGTKIEAVDGRLRMETNREGVAYDTDLIIFAAGVRPRDQLARDCGIEVGERGGIITDLSCQTSDPDVYAIGEVAAMEGMCYGLVAPGYSMAEVVADRLAGGEATFPGADMSTKLKLLGVDVAQFGAMEGPLSTTYLDPAHGTYAKLILSDDAQTLLGGMLVGDAEPYPLLRASVGGKVPGKLADLLGGGEIEGALPDGAQVCSCNAVTKGDIMGAIHEQGCTDVGELKACTKAGTSCGSCIPMLKQLLKEGGVEVSNAVCEHFTQSRAELFDIVKVTGITTFSELIARYGTGAGCDLCKPTVASILASLSNGHILEGEQASLQDTNDHFLANMQRNGTYSVVPRIPGGEITPDKLIVIGEVAKEFDLYTKITGGQRIDMFGARVEDLPKIWRKLVDAGFESGHAYGKALRTVKSCVGTDWCRYGVQDSVKMAIDLELRYRGLRSPHKLKSAVSGCARECAEARGKDFGIIATEHGWNLYVGGNGGFTPRHADLLLSDVDTETLVRTIDRFLMFYISTADRLQRTSKWVEGLEGGIDYLREVIVDDKLGICGELDALMEKHVENYADEWKGVIDDPEKLQRFVSFVNAPEAPDPKIEFETVRGQKFPAGTTERSHSTPVALGTPTRK